MESQPKYGNDHEPPTLADFCKHTFPSSKIHQQDLNYAHQQFPLATSVCDAILPYSWKPFDPFDPFLHGSSSGFGFNPYEGNSLACAVMQEFQGGELLNIPNMRDFVMALNSQDVLEPIQFIIPDEGSCVTNTNNDLGGRNAKKGKNSSKSKGNERSRCLSTRKSSRGSNKPRSMKGQWTDEENKLLVRLVEIYGVRKWSHIAQMMKGRIGKQCRERWHNHLKPDIKKDQWTEEEDRILIEEHEKVGNKWAEIAKRLPGRTENSIKNHWNATKRRQFARRKCRTKWAKPSHILQNYMKRIYMEKGSNSNSKVPNTATPTDDNPRSLNNNNNNNNTPIGKPELDPVPVDAHTEPEYNLDEVLDFNFDDYKVFDGSSMDSSVNVIPSRLPPEVDDDPCFDMELPLDISTLIPL